MAAVERKLQHILQQNESDWIDLNDFVTFLKENYDATYDTGKIKPINIRNQCEWRIDSGKTIIKKVSVMKFIFTCHICHISHVTYVCLQLSGSICHKTLYW